MLAVLASTFPKPVEESVDRDPGILTLAATLLNAWQRRHERVTRRRRPAA